MVYCRRQSPIKQRRFCMALDRKEMMDKLPKWWSRKRKEEEVDRQIRWLIFQCFGGNIPGDADKKPKAD